MRASHHLRQLVALLIVPIALVLVGCSTGGVSGREPILAAPLPGPDAPNRPYIFIAREVKNPGWYSWSPGMTLTDAIISAGGFTEFAGRTKIRVFHKDDSVTGPYNYDKILKHQSADPILEPADRIQVVGSLE